jgi:PKD repeat protein
MAIELDSGEVAGYRVKGQWGKKYLAIAQYHNIYTALLSAVPSSTDRVIEISFDNGAGVGAYTVADVREDMTLYVASAGASVGDYDLGMCRIRVVPDETGGSGTFYIGDTSNIEWEDNAVLTVVDDYQIRTKPVRVVSGEVFADSAIDYVAQHTVFDPVPVLGTHHAVWLDQTDEGEKITNGTFTTTTAGWTAGAGALLTIVSNALHIDRNGGGVVDHASQTIKTQVGKTYLLSVDIKIVSHEYQVYADGVLVIDNDGTGVKTASFVATGATAVIAFRATDNAAATLDIDDVTVNQVPLASVRLGPGADTESWVLGSTIDSVLWEIDGALSVDDLEIVNPTAVFDTAGTYLAYCTVTAVAGSTTAWGVRYVMVYDRSNPPITDFELSNRGAQYSSGGYSFDVKINSGASGIREHSLAILFSENYNDSGRFYRTCPIEGAEDIDCVGYICKQDTVRDYDTGSVTFTVEGAAEYMKQIYGSACTLELKTTATAWTHMPLLTVTRFVWHFLYWRTTSMRVMDVTLPPDELYDVLFNSLQNSIWSQIEEVSRAKLFASPGVDSFGRFWLEIDPQMVPVADRTWPVVQDLKEQDWSDILEWDKDDKTDSASLASAGISVNAGGNSGTYYSLSPGHIPNLFGGVDEIMDNVPLVTGQTHSNELCGLLAGWNNNPRKYMTIQLVAPFRAIDLWSRQFLSITISPSDDPLGIGYSGNIVPRELSYEYDPLTGSEVLTLVAEAESFPQVAINGDIPEGEDLPFDNSDVYDNFKDPVFDDPVFDDVVIGDDFANVDCPTRVLVHDTNHGLWWTDTFDELEPIWQLANGALDDEDAEDIDMLLLDSNGGSFISFPLGSPSGSLRYAASPLGSYEIVLSAADMVATWAAVVATLPPGTIYTYEIRALGINKGSNEIGVIVSLTIVGSLFKMMIGGAGGFTALPCGGLAPNPDYYGNANAYFNILTYGGGLWSVLWAQTGVVNNHVTTINPAGASITDRAIGVGALYVMTQARLGSGSSVLFLSGGTLLSTVDNYVNQTTVALTPVTSQFKPIFASDLTGQYLMCSDDAYLYKSLDGGVNWSAAIELPVDFPAIISNVFCVDADRWIVIGKTTNNLVTGNVIIYSDDFGITWQDKKGNLIELAAALNAPNPGTNLALDLIGVLP